MNLAHIRVVARQELLDLFRNRQVWISLLIQPVILLVAMGFIGYISEQRGNAFRTQEFKVAVSGARDDTAAFEELLREHRFRTVRTRDVEDAVVGKDVEVGLLVPSGAAERLRDARPVDLEVLYMKNLDQSEVALGRLRVAMSEHGDSVIRERLDARGLPESIAEPIRVKSTPAGSTDRGARLLLSNLLPGILLLQTVALVATAAQRLSGSKEKRTLEPLLVLPIARRDILAGAGVAAFVVGVIPVAAFIVPVMAVTLLPFAFATGLSSPIAVAATLLIVAPLVASLMVAIGLTLGALTRTAEGSSAVSNVAFVPIFALGMLFLTVDSVPSHLPMFAIPVFGAALFTRETIANGVSITPLLVTTVSTVVVVALLLSYAARALDAERSIVRPSG